MNDDIPERVFLERALVGNLRMCNNGIAPAIGGTEYIRVSKHKEMEVEMLEREAILSEQITLLQIKNDTLRRGIKHIRKRANQFRSALSTALDDDDKALRGEDVSTLLKTPREQP